MKTNNILGILGGVALGATLGILFAPDKGSKTRRKLKNKAIDTKDNLQESVNNLLDTVKDNFSDLKSKGEELLKEGEAKLEQQLKK